ncbi:hypothetical protein HYW44_03145 [Candidatus Daviesbacteria bacterium]|nr:hypothetical protein [Candidatus Daviesbacteria bacterium]
MDTIIILSIGLLAGCAIALSWFTGSDAPYVPTTMRLISKVLKAAGIKKGKVFYELGSGDGRVVIEAAKLGGKANGVEQSWLRVWLSRYNSRLSGTNKQTHFCHGNIFDRNYYPADIVYIYLLKPAVEKLEHKLKKELNKGSIVITQTYHFKKWKPYKKMGTKTSDFRLGGDFQFYRV